MSKGQEDTWNWAHFIWAASIMIIFPNSIMWLFANAYNLERPYVDVDYAIVMLIFLANRRFLGVMAVVVVFFFDVLALVGQVFPILRLSDTFYMAKFIGSAPIGYKASLVMLILVCAVLIFVFLYNNEKRNKLAFLACINLVILFYGVSAIFFNDEVTVVWSRSDRAIISSQVVFGIDSRNIGFVDSLFAEGDLFGEVPLSGATKPWFDDISNVDEKVLLIVNESWGIPDDDIQSAVMSPLLDVRNTMVSEWDEGILDFSGITVEAEIRELCRADLMHFNFEGRDQDLIDCIPNRLKETGYNTFAFHGAAGLMYDRAKWYPKIGFDNTVFFENYTWPERCYSFPGACDVDMADHVAKSYASSDRVFGYWLTLNTHHQYDLRDLSVESLFQCDDIGVRPGTEACRNFKLQYQFFKSLAGIVSRPEMSDVRVVVVSDHEPRISDRAEMDEYFQRGKVPWVSFKVK